MNINQAIVIVNEYSIKVDSEGTRGSTPGDYVTRYMSREDAIERVAPIRINDIDNYTLRYMARRTATESLPSLDDVKQNMYNDGYGGVAFGDNDISLSHEKVKAISADIQKCFDNGKTVMKTVISFDTNYLKQQHVIPEDFEFHRDGDFRGNVDQMKLRFAISHGMKRLSRNYDNLQWVGVIQVDTEHIHCHLCMVDKGRGRITSDGTQKGKLSAKDIQTLRRGIDLSLEEMHPVKIMSSNITQDRRNVKCYIKQYVQKEIKEHGTIQFLFACLPEDTRLWRAGTNDKRMQKANTLARNYVMQFLNDNNTLYTNALRNITQYADIRQKRESLSNQEYRKLIEQGKKRLINECVNSVYSVLKAVPKSDRTVQTPMLTAMCSDYDAIVNAKNDDKLMEFGFKLRSYSSRLEHHKQERSKYHTYAKAYEIQKQNNAVSVQSAALYDFYKFEEEYNTMLMSKYQHLLSFPPIVGIYKKEEKEEFQRLMIYNNRIKQLKKMRADESIRGMTADDAEKYGKDTYDVSGGRYAATAPNIINNIIQKMQNEYKRMKDDYNFALASNGLAFVDDGNNSRVVRKTVYAFNMVKSLDLHHLQYDFPYEVTISKSNIAAFTETANKRYEKFAKAIEYLQKTKQSEFVNTLPLTDVRDMYEYAKKLSDNGAIRPKTIDKPLNKQQQNVYTISLNNDYSKNIQFAIQNTVQSMQYGE